MASGRTFQARRENPRPSSGDSEQYQTAKVGEERTKGKGFERIIGGCRWIEDQPGSPQCMWQLQRTCRLRDSLSFAKFADKAIFQLADTHTTMSMVLSTESTGRRRLVSDVFGGVSQLLAPSTYQAHQVPGLADTNGSSIIQRLPALLSALWRPSFLHW